MDNKYLQWLQKHAADLKIRSIEVELEMPEGTLKKFTDLRRGLPENWHKPVEKWVKKHVKELIEP